MIIASFDIGIRNFAFLIEEFNIDIFKDIKNIDKKKRYNPDGTCTDEFKKIINKIYLNGEIKLMKNQSISYIEKNSLLSFHKLIDILDKYKQYWDKTDLFLIEKQINLNYTASRLSIVCISYFMFNYSHFKKIVEFPSYYKTSILGAPRIFNKSYKSGIIKYKNMNKTQRKKWAVEEFRNILKLRNQDFPTNIKKLDDISDIEIQSQAFKYLFFVDNMKF
jgi:hypothetical protein